MDEGRKLYHGKNTREGHSSEMQACKTLGFSPEIIECLSFPVCYHQNIGFLYNNIALYLKELEDRDSLWGLIREPQNHNGDKNRGTGGP